MKIGDRISSTFMPRGVPRPLYKGLPIPYITYVIPFQSIPVFRRVSVDRRNKCATEGLCQVCGLQLEYGAISLHDGSSRDPSAIDGAGLHTECLELAVRYCPFLRERSLQIHPWQVR